MKCLETAHGGCLARDAKNVDRLREAFQNVILEVDIGECLAEELICVLRNDYTSRFRQALQARSKVRRLPEDHLLGKLIVRRHRVDDDNPGSDAGARLEL